MERGPRALAHVGLMATIDPSFWRGRSVLLTGHTGFKGAWCAYWLTLMGARVTGFALAPETTPNLFDLARIAEKVDSRIGDIRDRSQVEDVVAECDPEIVLHFAAQPFVRRSVREPVETFATNVLGTAHLLDALRKAPSLAAVLVVTTDKVYKNPETREAFRESAGWAATILTRPRRPRRNWSRIPSRRPISKPAGFRWRPRAAAM